MKEKTDFEKFKALAGKLVKVPLDEVTDKKSKPTPKRPKAKRATVKDSHDR